MCQQSEGHSAGLQQAHADARIASFLEGGAVQLCVDDNRGRYLRAARAITQGEVVMVARPYVTAILPSHKKRCCAGCFRDWRQRLSTSCSGCGFCHYCSEACKLAHHQAASEQRARELSPSTSTATPVAKHSTAGTFPVVPETTTSTHAETTTSTQTKVASNTQHGSTQVCAESSKKAGLQSIQTEQPAGSAASCKWFSQPVPHSLLCPVIKRMSSFKLDDDMKAILFMCLEALGRDVLHHQQPPAISGRSCGSSNTGMAEVSSHRPGSEMLPTNNINKQCSAEASTPVYTGQRAFHQDNATLPGGAADQPEHTYMLNDFMLLVSHMDSLPQKEQAEWRKGCKELLDAMRKAGWPGALPPEAQLMGMCGRILANNFGIFYTPPLSPAAPGSISTGLHVPDANALAQLQTPADCKTANQCSLGASIQADVLAMDMVFTSLTDRCSSPDAATHATFSTAAHTTPSTAAQTTSSTAAQTTPSTAADVGASSLTIAAGTQHQAVPQDTAAALHTSNVTNNVAAGNVAQAALQTHQQGLVGSDGSGNVGKAGTKAHKEELTGRQVFLPLSLFNHSCAPNCTVQAGSFQAVVTADKDIPAGAELNITYIETDLPRSARQALCNRLYNFTCTCARCSEELLHGMAGDKHWAWAQQGAQGLKQKQGASQHARERNRGGGHKGGGCSVAARKQQEQRKQPRK